MDERIEINLRTHHGQPVIKGTRVPVARILAQVAAGTSVEEIQRQYDVTVEDIRAAVAFGNTNPSLLDSQNQSFSPLEMPGGSLADDIIRDRR